MTNEIRARIDLIRQGKVPEGYVRTRAGIMPSDWPTTIKARDVFYSYSVKSSGCGLTVLSATQDRGIVPRSEVDIDIKYDTNNLDSYKKVDVGDFVISLRSFQGGIECSAYEGIVSPAYTVLKNRIAICNGYYREYFKTDDFIARLNGAVYGIRDGKQIGFDDFGDMLIHCPSLQEQERIAKILSTCDRIIDKYEEETEQYRKLKQYLLNKMFPKEGSAVPEIRFPGFTDTWEQRKIKEVCSISTGKSNTQDKIDDGIYPFYVRSPIIERSNRYLYDEEAVLTVGDGAGTGKVFHYVNGKYDLHQRVYRLFGFSEEFDAKFFYHWFSANFYDRVMSMTAKTSVDSVRLEMIADMEMTASSYDEQKKISSCLDQLDHLITLHQREADAWKTKKKAMAQLLLTGIVRV